MTGTPARARRMAPLLLLVSAVVVLVTSGLAQGVRLSNLHNALLALSFTGVAAYVLHQRPGHRVGRLFLATGVVEAVLFCGRQVGSSPVTGISRWWAWFGVWPVVVALALTTLSVMCFPDGRLPSRRWRPVAAAVVAVAVLCAVLSAGWPVEYAAAGVRTSHPFRAGTPAGVTAVWSAVAHPAYVGFQVLWLVVVVTRWRTSGGRVRRQLAWLVTGAGVSAGALVLGLAVTGSPRAGILTAALVPLSAGWAIVHGQHLAARSALTWLSRSDPRSSDLPDELAGAVAQALGAPGASVWMGPLNDLRLVGVWPAPVAAASEPTVQPAPADQQLRPVRVGGTVIGAIGIDRPAQDALPLADQRLFDDLAAQAALVLEHQGLAEVIARQRRAGNLEGLTPREQEVLELLSRGLSNAAICQELHLSIKTVEPVVGAIFTKLGLHQDAGSNRRVLAALAYLQGR